MRSSTDLKIFGWQMVIVNGNCLLYDTEKFGFVRNPSFTITFGDCLSHCSWKTVTNMVQVLTAKLGRVFLEHLLQNPCELLTYRIQTSPSYQQFTTLNNRGLV